MGSRITQLAESLEASSRGWSQVRLLLRLQIKKNMVNIYKRHIKREIAKATLPLGMDTLKLYTDFVINAPIWQWKKRLWVITHASCILPLSEMEKLVLFLDE